MAFPKYQFKALTIFNKVNFFTHLFILGATLLCPAVSTLAKSLSIKSGKLIDNQYFIIVGTVRAFNFQITLVIAKMTKNIDWHKCCAVFNIN